jgi:hypothetical protein
MVTAILILMIIIQHNKNKQEILTNSNNSIYGKYYIYIAVLQNNSIKTIKN